MQLNVVKPGGGVSMQSNRQPFSGRQGTCNHLLMMICHDLIYDGNYNVANVWTTLLQVYGYVEAA